MRHTSSLPHHHFIVIITIIVGIQGSPWLALDRLSRSSDGPPGIPPRLLRGMGEGASIEIHIHERRHQAAECELVFLCIPLLGRAA